MIFKIKNTKTGEIKELEMWEVDREFTCDTFTDTHCSKKEYEATLLLLDDEEKKDYIEKYKNVELYNDEEYYTKMVEYITWCSPSGIKPVWELIEVK